MSYRPHKNGVDDLVLLDEMSNEAVNATLKQHHAADEIYIYIGHVLIALNPYKEIRGLYGDAALKRYKGRLPFENMPHVYALAESVHRTMTQQRDNHCVIISGESGAGKTENSKRIMEYIAFVSSKAAGVTKVKEQILESNPLLEAFGNAKTLRNDNSSRFGKYFEIQFDFRGDPVGGNIRNYLLEKIRVVQQQSGERNFHVFYQLLAGASDQEKKELELYAPQYYQYLNQSGCVAVNGMDDAREYRETRNAMNVIGMTAEEQIEVFRMVAAVLHVGNLKFVDSGKSVAPENKDVLAIAARMLRVTPDALLKSLTNKTISTATETVTSPLTVAETAYSRDSLAKSLYGRLFDWVVVRCNDLMYKAEHEGFIIGVLDIYGFEIFERNSFEQLCINFCNEKLHQIFIELTLKAEQEEYRKEGIKWEDVQYYNNKPCVEVIERKNGVFGYLDEECVFPKGTDTTYLEKIISNIKGHSNFEKASIKGCFLVKHYAGDVIYSVEGFLDKNKDLLLPDIIRLLSSSQSQLVKRLFERDLSLLKDSKKRPLTAGTQFRNQMQSLMESLMACTPHYVRCIKPNANKRPGEWTDALCLGQIRYLGLLENVKVRRAGYAFRLPFGQFLRRYKMLSSKTWPAYKGNEQEGCRLILGDLGVPNDWAFGTTKIFIKSPQTVFKLEEQREKKLDFIVVKIQRSWRAFQSRKWYLELRAAMQDIFYGKKQRRKNSINRKFWGDYLKIARHPMILDIMRKGGDTTLRFSDNLWKTNKKYKRQLRTLIITDKAIYVLNPGPKYSVVRRIDLKVLTSVGLSELADNYFILRVESEYDYLLDNIRKTEIVTLLKELLDRSGRQLQLIFSNQLSYRIKSKKMRTVKFEESATAPENGTLVGNGDSAVVSVAAGLPPTSSPRAIYKTKTQRNAPNQSTGASNYGQAGAPAWASSTTPTTTSSAPQGAAQRTPAPLKQRTMSIRIPMGLVLFDYAAQAVDELNLKEGDQVEIINKDASGWWTGRMNGRVGLFPGNYIKEVAGPGINERANYPYGA